MKKPPLVKELTRKGRVQPAHAADQVDRVVDQLLRTLRAGKPARLPGLGTINPGKEWTFRAEENER
jgi:nucleoid DNA-binding protein